VSYAERLSGIFCQLTCFKGDNDKMKKTFTVTGVALLFAMTAAATEWPKYEAYLGYDFVRCNPNSGFFPSFNANGETASSCTTLASGLVAWPTLAL
jgi:hypothetical protein